MGVYQRSARGLPDSPSVFDAPINEQIERAAHAVRKTCLCDGHTGGDGEGGCAPASPDPRHVARPTEQWVSPPRVRQELAACERRAKEGDAESARRAAELHEALHEFTTAANWWRKAAALGDQDAIDHVKYILR